jgi:hypothetical protein
MRLTPALDFDVYCPLMSMPGLLKTTLESVPADVPYLFAAPDLVKQLAGETRRDRPVSRSALPGGATRHQATTEIARSR